MNDQLNGTKLSPAVLRIIKRAAVEAESAHEESVTVANLLVAILHEGNNVGAQLFQEKEITVDMLRTLNFAK